MSIFHRHHSNLVPDQGCSDRLPAQKIRSPFTLHPAPFTRRGTTLVEILVMIVIFLVGILAILQIFPGGLRLLSQTRDRSMATFLAHDEIERLKGRADLLPEMIVPVKYDDRTGVLGIYVDDGRNPDDVAVLGDILEPTQLPNNIVLPSKVRITINPNNYILGDWSSVSGANVLRRVIGEGIRIPAPKDAFPITPPVAKYFGSLATLQFGPAYILDDTDPNISVYGEDLVRQEGDNGRNAPEPYEYFVAGADDAAPTIYFPTPPVSGQRWHYHVRLAAYIDVGGGTIVRREFFDLKPPVAIDYDSTGIAGILVNGPNLDLGVPPANLKSVDLSSIRVSREFKRIDVGTDFSTTDPYEYKLFDAGLGQILFNPKAHGLYESRPNGRREPVRAKIDYDVLDWRIIRDDFRVAATDVPQYKLALRALKVKGDEDFDRSTYLGMPFQAPESEASGLDKRDFVLVDLETGGVVNTNSYIIDKSNGLLRFIDSDINQSGLQAQVVLSDPDTASGNLPFNKTVNIVGRSLRALYEARGEWSVQPLIAAPRYFETQTWPPGRNSFFLENGRIYFSWGSVGQRVTIENIYYWPQAIPGSGEPSALHNQSFVIQQPNAADPRGLPFVDIQAQLSLTNFSFDTNHYGYAVDGVEGASLTVRVLWNRSALLFEPNANPNYVDINRARFDRWAQDYRRVKTESFFKKGDVK